MFSEAMLDFLLENRFHNDKEWFHAHKAEYQTLVLEPLAALVTAMTPAILAVDDQIVTEPKVGKTISRIYRDTRFSKDKSLYRAEMWLSIKRDKKAFPCFPEFFFIVGPEGWSIGAGYYQVLPDALAEVRRRVSAQDEGFRAAQAVLTKHPEYTLGGEAYKRTRHPDAPEALRPWLDRKNYYVVCDSDDFSALYAPDLGERMAAEIPKLAPVYRFFLDTELRVLAEKYRQ